MKIQYKIIIALPIFALSNCATIVSKSDYAVRLNSNTPKRVTVKNKATNTTVYSGTAPATVILPASEGFFQPAKYSLKTNRGTQSLNATMDPWYAGNILFSGFIGGLIDPATGAMWKLPDEVQLN